MATITLPTPLRPYAANQREVEISADTVGNALEGLVKQYPDLANHLFGDDGKLRSFVNVYLNEEDVRFLENAKTQLQENDTLTIIPSIAGG